MRVKLKVHRAGLTGALAVVLLVAALILPTGVAATRQQAGTRSARQLPADVRAVRWTASSPAPGLRLLSGTFADPGVRLHWTVTVQAPTTSPFDGRTEYEEAGSPTWAQQTKSALIAAGFTPRLTTLEWPRYLDDPRGVMGIRVRVGEFDTMAAATSQAGLLTAAGFHPVVEWEGVDADRNPDADQLHAIVVDPRRFHGHVMAYHGTAIAGRQTVAGQAQQLGSLAAVNGGFFTINSQLTAVAGAPTGLGIYDGKLEALTNDRRADLVLNGDRPARIENLTASVELRAADGARRILGINRQPGSAEDCGVPDFGPTSAPRQGTICTGSNDLVLFTSEFGAPLPGGPGIQATIDAGHKVLALTAPGGLVPAGGQAVQAVGADAAWLSAHLHPGDSVALREQLRGSTGAPFRLRPGTSVASAAPVLLRGGHPWIDAVGEGVFDPRDQNNYGFSAQRHARTLAGIDRRGRLLLVTVDGIPRVSEGYTLTEAADLMRRLGAISAMNLDGGGSTSFVIGGNTINHTSDPTGPRPIGDSIQVVPNR